MHNFFEKNLAKFYFRIHVYQIAIITWIIVKSSNKSNKNQIVLILDSKEIKFSKTTLDRMSNKDQKKVDEVNKKEDESMMDTTPIQFEPLDS